MSIQERKNEVGEVRTIHESTGIIRENEQIMGRSAIRIGQELEYIKENKTYKQLGYQNIVEYGENTLGYKRSNIDKLLRIGREYDLSSGRGLNKLSIKDLYSLTKIDDKESREEVAEKRSEVNQKEFTQLIEEKKQALEEKRKAEQAKIKTEEELERLKREIEQVKNQPPKIEKEVIEKKVVPEDYEEMKKQLAVTQEEIETLEERAGQLDKYRSEIRGYSQKKKQVESEIADLLEYQRELEQKNSIIAQRAKIVQRVSGAVNGLEQKKAEIEELFKSDVQLENSDIQVLKMKAEFLEDMANMFYSYINTKQMGDDYIDIN